MDIKGIIFDLDGVLCSTDSCHYLAWKELADFLDIPFDETVNQRLRGVSRMESLKIILEAADRNFSDQEKIELAERKNERYRNITRSKPDPEVFLLAAEKLGLPPSECMVVEDADAGIEAAFKGGFIPVGIGPAQNNINAVYHLTRFEQLKEIVF